MCEFSFKYSKQKGKVYIHIYPHTHTHTHIYIYIYRERERERGYRVFLAFFYYSNEIVSVCRYWRWFRSNYDQFTVIQCLLCRLPLTFIDALFRPSPPLLPSQLVEAHIKPGRFQKTQARKFYNIKQLIICFSDNSVLAVHEALPVKTLIAKPFCEPQVLFFSFSQLGSSVVIIFLEFFNLR